MAGKQHQDTSVGCLHSEGAAAAARRGEKIHIYINPASYHTGFPALAHIVKQFSGVFVEVTKPLLSLRRKPVLTEALSCERLNPTSPWFFFFQ